VNLVAENLAGREIDDRVEEIVDRAKRHDLLPGAEFADELRVSGAFGARRLSGRGRGAGHDAGGRRFFAAFGAAEEGVFGVGDDDDVAVIDFHFLNALAVEERAVRAA
jgi:hypothetical protein